MNTIPDSSTLLPSVIKTDREPSRCHHRFSNGKRCRLPGLDSQLGLCLRHFTLGAAADLSRKNSQMTPKASPSSSLATLPSSPPPSRFSSFYPACCSSSPGDASLPAAPPFLSTSPTSFAFHTQALAPDGTRTPASQPNRTDRSSFQAATP